MMGFGEDTDEGCECAILRGRISDLEHELYLAKKSSNEFRDKLQASVEESDESWDEALDAAMSHIGHHIPACLDKCMLCWVHGELKKMKRGSSGNRASIMERIEHLSDSLMAECHLPVKERDGYFRGLTDMVRGMRSIYGVR